MDPALREGYETSRRMQRRHDPTYYFATRRLPAEIRPATHALYGYVRTADQIVDGPRRPATPDGRRAALDAWEAELEAGASPASRSSARSPTPPPATASRSASCAPTCARCGSTARRCGSPAGTSSSPTWTAPRARSGGSWPRCSAFRRVITPTSAASASRSSSPTSSATCARTRRWTASTCPPRTASASASASTTCAADARRPAVRALVAHEVERARGLFAGARPAIASAPASVRPGVNFATRPVHAHARPRRGDGLRRPRPPDRRPRLAHPGRGAGGDPVSATRPRGPRRARVTQRATARRRAHRHLPARRRPDLRGELRRAGGRARAQGLRRRRAGRRPLRDRRARHLGLRRADAVAARDGRRALDPAGDPLHGVPHAARLAPASACRGAGRASTTGSSARPSTSRPTPASRSRRSRRETATGPHRPRDDLTAR